MHWMTPNVVALLAGIEAESAWDRLPILADALEEGGFEDGPALLAMRSGDDLLAKPWLRRVVEGKARFSQVKESYEWLAKHAKEFSDTDYAEGDEYGGNFERPTLRNRDEAFEWLMAVCATLVQTGDHEYLGFSATQDTYDKGEELWKHYEVLTGIPPPREKYGNQTLYAPTPFACAC